MTQARRLLPNQVHSFCRRTTQRKFLLRPDERVNETVAYALGLALLRNPRFRLHAFMSESTHQHANGTDASTPGQQSQVPSFWELYDGLVARALNSHYGRGENFWKPGSYDNVEIHDDASLEDQLLYTWTNPVKDGLVETPEEWPGVKFLPEDFGKTFTVKKPKEAFFGGRRPPQFVPSHPSAREEHLASLRKQEREARAIVRERDRDAGLTRKQRKQAERQRRQARAREKRRAPRDRSSLPESVTFTLHAPPGFEHLPIEEVRAYFRKLLDERVAQIHAERRAAGKTRFLGVAKILAQDPYGSSGGTSPTFELNPRVACKDKKKRIQVLQGLIAWRKTYRACRESWRGKGKRRVVFPLGTFGVRKLHGARVSREPLVLEAGLLRSPPRAA
jgi:hypothetical protein